MAEGQLGNISTGSGLSVQNVFDLGKYALQGEIFTKAFEYFDTALELQTLLRDKGNTNLREELLNVMDGAAALHDMKLVTGKFLQQRNPYYFVYPIRHLRSENRIPVSIWEFAKTHFKQDVVDILFNFDLLCDTVDLRSPMEKKDLYCQFLWPHPFFRIQPMKIEWLHLQPNLIQIYDFLSEPEITRLRKEADPILSRSGVVKPDSIGYVLQRTSSQAWIYDTMPFSRFNFISTRIAMATGLSLDDSTTEPLQIANYGPGGIYVPHYDALGKGKEADETLSPHTAEEFLMGMGDRMATFMIYLADVEGGGGTAFPRLRVAAQPIKGSAILWFNVYRDGMTLDRDSIHGGCPVLYGSKYIANKTKRPYQIPGYAGVVPGMKFEEGHTFSKATHELMLKHLIKPGPKGPRTSFYPDPCRGHEADLRSRFHLLQGEIDPFPCQWHPQNVFCVQKPRTCPRKLQKNNQHGYLSRLSVYDSPNMEVTACKASNLAPCPGREPQGKPFWKEYEDMTNYDPFQEYSPECRHVRLPKLKYRSEGCWDEDMYIPAECLCDYRKLGVVRKPNICECLPLDPLKSDMEVKYHRVPKDSRNFLHPYFADPTNPMRYFIPGFKGHVPTEKFQIGDTYEKSTRKALNRFTTNYLFPHLLDRCPVYLDPEQYCDDLDYFSLQCDRRKSYDGHFDEKPIRDRLKPEFDPKKCPRPLLNEPYPLCITPNQ